MLSHQPRSGAKSTLPQWAETALRDRLAQPEGFEGDAAIQHWLATEWGVVAPYKTVHKWVYYRLGASPKANPYRISPKGELP